MPVADFGNKVFRRGNVAVFASVKSENLRGILFVPRVLDKLRRAIAVDIVKKCGLVMAWAGVNKLVNWPTVDVVLPGSGVFIPVDYRMRESSG